MTIANVGRRAGRADQCPKIVHILHAIEDQQQCLLGQLCQHILQLRVAVAGQQRHHALMVRAVGQPVQRGRLLKAHRDALPPR